MVRFAPKEIWVFRYKNTLDQLETFAHELAHAVICEYGLEQQIGKLEEHFLTQFMKGFLLSLWRLGGRWPVWELQALGGQVQTKSIPKGIKE